MKAIRFFLLFLVVGIGYSAELRPETILAWQAYIESVSARMTDHLRFEHHFITVNTDVVNAERLKSGEVLIWPSDSGGIKKIPSGLINDWTGAVFISHATLDDVFSVIHDYDSYKEFYPSTVLNSKTLSKDNRSKNDEEDRFSMRLMNSSLFAKMALDSEYKCSSVRVDASRVYSISETTHIWELEQYGTPDQRKLPEGQGTGLIWRLFSIMQLEERDEGVYIKLQVIALSRDIPGSLRWLIEPIVRRISKSTLTVSLQQTAEAVQSRGLRASSHHASKTESHAF
jgi:hypothetical protein